MTGSTGRGKQQPEPGMSQELHAAAGQNPNRIPRFATFKLVRVSFYNCPWLFLHIEFLSMRKINLIFQGGKIAGNLTVQMNQIYNAKTINSLLVHIKTAKQLKVLLNKPTSNKLHNQHSLNNSLKGRKQEHLDTLNIFSKISLFVIY